MEIYTTIFNVPVGVSLDFNNWAGRAYNLIWNEWFRDENLQNSVTVDKGDGPDTASDYVLLKKGKHMIILQVHYPHLKKVMQ